jgi:hypothetical protein
MSIRDNGLTPEQQREGAAQRQKAKGLTNFHLKLMGIILIFLNVLSNDVLLPLIPDIHSASMGDLTFVVLLEAASWIALPIYAWLLVEGFAHTRNAGFYLLRLFILALITEVPYDLSYTGNVFDWSSQNPVWALLICLIVLIAMKYLAERKNAIFGLVRVIIVIAAVIYMWVLHVDVRLGAMQGGIVLLGLTLIFYFLRKKENTMVLAGALVGVIGFGVPIIGLIAIHARNEKLGYRRTWTKWVFYALYPAMLLLFGLLR